MPLAKPISDLRQEIKLLVLDDLPTAMKLCKDLLPENSEKSNLVLGLQANLKELNKDRMKNLITMEECSLRLSRIVDSFLDLVSGLEAPDFEAPFKSNGQSLVMKHSRTLHHRKKGDKSLRPLSSLLDNPRWSVLALFLALLLFAPGLTLLKITPDNSKLKKIPPIATDQLPEKGKITTTQQKTTQAKKEHPAREAAVKQQKITAVPKDTPTDNTKLNFAMVKVEGGTFKMGNKDGGVQEKPVHEVTLSSFYLGKYEVTQAKWRAVMGDNPSNYSDCDKCPVESVSWNDVQAFIKKLNAKTGQNYRLPTEAEWEYAARGGNKKEGFTFAGSNDIDQVAWYSGNSGNKPHPVGGKKPNGLELYDMSGNVYEWCQDWFGEYPSTAQTNPSGAKTGSARVFRGGSWYYYSQFSHVAYRSDFTPVFRPGNIGFRLARTP